MYQPVLCNCSLLDKKKAFSKAAKNKGRLMSYPLVTWLWLWNIVCKILKGNFNVFWNRGVTKKAKFGFFSKGPPHEILNQTNSDIFRCLSQPSNLPRSPKPGARWSGPLDFGQKIHPAKHFCGNWSIHCID